MSIKEPLKPSSHRLDPVLLARIKVAPKAELHVHLEGTLEPETMTLLSQRNGIALPEDARDQATASNGEGSALELFLKRYYSGLSVLLTRQDFYDVAYAYLRRASGEGVVHAELYLSPQSHLERGISLDVVLDGITAAVADAGKDFGISAGLIYGLQRHRTEAAAFEALQAARPHREKILAVGLGGAERGNPPSKFERVFREAKSLGWPITIHAGEEGPPEYIREAIDLLHADRIDHGVACEGDPDLVAMLADRRIPMTICPLSNIVLKVFPSMKEHNLKRLLHAGCCVGVNSDDPPYFGGYMLENIVEPALALDLSSQDVHQLLRNGFEGSFVDGSRKRDYLAALDACWSAPAC